MNNINALISCDFSPRREWNFNLKQAGIKVLFLRWFMWNYVLEKTRQKRKWNMKHEWWKRNNCKANILTFLIIICIFDGFWCRINVNLNKAYIKIWIIESSTMFHWYILVATSFWFLILCQRNKPMYFLVTTSITRQFSTPSSTYYWNIEIQSSVWSEAFSFLRKRKTFFMFVRIDSCRST